MKTYIPLKSVTNQLSDGVLQSFSRPLVWMYIVRQFVCFQSDLYKTINKIPPRIDQIGSRFFTINGWTWPSEMVLPWFDVQIQTSMLKKRESIWLVRWVRWNRVAISGHPYSGAMKHPKTHQLFYNVSFFSEKFSLWFVGQMPLKWSSDFESIGTFMKNFKTIFLNEKNWETRFCSFFD